MRLLDRVARCRVPLLLGLDGNPLARFEVTDPSHLAARVAECPLRFVLGDDLTRVSAELAFADGARLAGCLDLLRVPARQLWVEWNDGVHQRVIHETQSASDYDCAALRRRLTSARSTKWFMRRWRPWPVTCPCCWRSFCCCRPRMPLVRLPCLGQRSIASDRHTAVCRCWITSKCAPLSTPGTTPRVPMPISRAANRRACTMSGVIW
jgi:hypothetical protein